MKKKAEDQAQEGPGAKKPREACAQGPSEKKRPHAQDEPPAVPAEQLAPSPVVPREMTPAEVVRHEAYRERRAATPKPVRFKTWEEDGKTIVGCAPSEPLSNFIAGFVAAMGTVDRQTGNTILEQGTNAIATVSGGDTLEGRVNAFAGLMTEIAPQDGLEGMLAAQMVACHSHALDCLRRAHTTTSNEVRKANLTFADRLMRTFTAQVEVLTKKRSKGKQVVEIHKHVHVHQGGQAIVAENVTTGGGEGHAAGIAGTTSGRGAITGAEAGAALQLEGGKEVWCPVQEHGEALPATGDAERPL